MCIFIYLLFRVKGFPTDNRHSNGHKLCPSSSRHISVLIRSGIHTVFALNWKEKIASQFNFTSDTSMTYYQSITQILRIIWVRFIPLSLRSKTRRRATPLLPTWIYSCRSRVTISCALPFFPVHLVLTHLGLAFVLMLGPFFPELVISTDLLSFEHPSVLLFCLIVSMQIDE